MGYMPLHRKILGGQSKLAKGVYEFRLLIMRLIKIRDAKANRTIPPFPYYDVSS